LERSHVYDRRFADRDHAAVGFAAAVPLGGYVLRVIEGERVALSARQRAGGAAVLTGLSGVDPAREQSWFVYTMSMLAFSLVGFLSLYALQRLQNVLPLNPRASTPWRPISPSTLRSASSPTPIGRITAARRQIEFISRK